MRESNPFHKKKINPPNLPADFQEVWDYFEKIDQEKPEEIGIDFDLHGITFEKSYSPAANCWLIGCHAKRLTDTAIVLAYVKTDGRRVLYRTSSENEWENLDNSDIFVDKLFELIDDPANQRQFYIMQQENDKKIFMGYFCAEEPYEIDNRSVKFAVSDTQCDLLLGQKEKKDAPVDDLAWISASIISNIYPKTSMIITPDTRLYKFITFNGFLFKPVAIELVARDLFKFKAQFIRDMKM